MIFTTSSSFKFFASKILVEEIFYSPEGLKYRGKLKQNIQVEVSLSWSPTVTVPLVDILETEDSKIGHYIYTTGKIE